MKKPLIVRVEVYNPVNPPGQYQARSWILIEEMEDTELEKFLWNQFKTARAEAIKRCI